MVAPVAENPRLGFKILAGITFAFAMAYATVMPKPAETVIPRWTFALASLVYAVYAINRWREARRNSDGRPYRGKELERLRASLEADLKRAGRR